MSIRFDNQVAIVTGAGGGLGKSYALALGKLGAKVVVNDMPGSAGAQAVVDAITAAGGEAMLGAANVADMAQVQAVVEATLTAWGRVDILINNAGILRDKSFSKMELAEFRLVLDVHLMGSVHFTKAVWETMRTQGFGRIVMTTSSSGIYGNFGQSNYGAAKAGLVGLMNVLAIEGAKAGIKVNCIAPTAATAMTAGLLPQQMLDLLTPDAVTPGVLFLCSKEAPTKTILTAGAGGFEVAHITMTQGVYLNPASATADDVAEAFSALQDRTGELVPEQGAAQGLHEISKATKHAGA
jgi:NAD(P)-dependent dehydrogenase (short-subunit alcohol dehydrogenase family)